MVPVSGLNTLTNGDVLVGGDGSDTLVVNMGAATAALDTTGIETVQIMQASHV